MRVEVFLPETSVEGFVLRVFGRLARAREVNLHAALVRPFVERLRNELAAILCLDIARKRTMMMRKPSHRSVNVLATQRAVDFNRQAFPRVVNVIGRRGCVGAADVVSKERIRPFTALNDKGHRSRRNSADITRTGL